jgi:DNA invertase Pin-like site-specific DNA recombinase
MNGFAKIRSTHLNRQAVVYLRLSDPKQVRQNRESAINQRALRERLRELGWKKEQISVIDGDQGVSGKHAAGREGFQKLVADVGLGKMGIIIGFEVSRLARNCADWHRLLELCALFDTLIADSDGIYNPRDFNDRLLLGLKGTMSEVELHSLRLRLDGGRLSKAKRGELVHHLPTGLVRLHDGAVAFDPDTCVQARIRLVLERFMEAGSAGKVLHHLVNNRLKLPRRQVSGLRVGEVLWKDPSMSAIYSILKNPAYAGAFAYGRRRADPTRQVPGRRATGRIRRPPSDWLALVKDVYPAYITWEVHEEIQRKLKENDQRMDERFARKRAVRPGAALLSGMVRCIRCGHAMRVAYKDQRFQYKCDGVRSKYGKHSCQVLSGHRIDDAVVCEFFRVLEPAQIDALQKVSEKQAEHQWQREKQVEQEIVRLVQKGSVMWTDDTHVTVLGGAEIGSHKGRFWVYIGPATFPYDVYDFTANRKRDGPARFLANYVGYLHADAFSGYDGIYTGSDGRILEVACWAHARRKFFEARSSSPAEAALILQMIRRLYEVEDRARPLDEVARRALRQAQAVPVLERLREELDRLSARLLPKSALAQATTYALNQWQALCCYTQDGRLTIDNNVSERRLRDQAIGRKNRMFLGSDEAGPRAAVLCTIIAGAKRHRLEPWAYLHDVILQLSVDASPESLAKLLPERWALMHPEHVLTHRLEESRQKAHRRDERRGMRRLRSK